MSYPTLEDHFEGLWNRARRYPSLDNLSPELIQKWASERGLDVDEVEHPFRVLKCQFGYLKARYRGLAKNTAHIETQFALANLWMARKML
ncbi:hypothetical protein CBA19C8_33535 [Paraburkholderia terrae]|nr:transposase [Paraburkholderia terrae]GJH05586.1 hypothetical protein CBA19C8_33535 [Paraburkholderia terrae]